MLETLLVLPAILLVLIGLVLFTQLCAAKLAVEQAAWQGMLLVVTTDAGREVTRQHINQVLQQLIPSLPAVSSQGLTFNAGHGWENPASLSLRLHMEHLTAITRVLGRRGMTLTGSSTCYNRSWIFWDPRDPAFRLPGLVALRRQVLAGMRGHWVSKSWPG